MRHSVHQASSRRSGPALCRTSLGFDVSDGFLLSCLTNCGYREDEVEALRARWTSCLNVHHLFTRAADASAFRDMSNARVKEHAPFFVYGIRLVTARGRD
jgi:hypothetical protein